MKRTRASSAAISYNVSLSLPSYRGGKLNDPPPPLSHSPRLATDVFVTWGIFACIVFIGIVTVGFYEKAVTWFM